jgi:hypothetical protein
MKDEDVVDKAVEEIKLGAEKLKKTWGIFT